MAQDTPREGLDISPEITQRAERSKNMELARELLSGNRGEPSLNEIMGIMIAQHEGIPNADQSGDVLTEHDLFVQMEVDLGFVGAAVASEINVPQHLGLSEAISRHAHEFDKGKTPYPAIRTVQERGKEPYDVVDLHNREQLQGYLAAREALGVPSSQGGNTDLSTIAEMFEYVVAVTNEAGSYVAKVEKINKAVSHVPRVLHESVQRIFTSEVAYGGNLEPITASSQEARFAHLDNDTQPGAEVIQLADHMQSAPAERTILFDQEKNPTNPQGVTSFGEIVKGVDGLGYDVKKPGEIQSSPVQALDSLDGVEGVGYRKNNEE